MEVNELQWRRQPRADHYLSPNVLICLLVLCIQTALCFNKVYASIKITSTPERLCCCPILFLLVNVCFSAE